MAIFILETTRPGGLPRRALMHDEGVAREQMLRAMASGQFERVALVLQSPGSRRVLYDSDTDAPDSPARIARDAAAAAVASAWRASWAVVTGLIIAILFFAAKWALNG